MHDLPHALVGVQLVDWWVAFHADSAKVTRRMLSTLEIFLAEPKASAAAGVPFTSLYVILLSGQVRILRSGHGAQQLHLLTATLLSFGLAGALARTIVHLGDRLLPILVHFGIGTAAHVVLIIVSCRLEAAEAICEEFAEV